MGYKVVDCSVEAEQLECNKLHWGAVLVVSTVPPAAGEEAEAACLLQVVAVVLHFLLCRENSYELAQIAKMRAQVHTYQLVKDQGRA